MEDVKVGGYVTGIFTSDLPVQDCLAPSDWHVILTFQMPSWWWPCGSPLPTVGHGSNVQHNSKSARHLIIQNVILVKIIRRGWRWQWEIFHLWKTKTKQNYVLHSLGIWLSFLQLTSLFRFGKGVVCLEWIGLTLISQAHQNTVTHVARECYFLTLERQKYAKKTSPSHQKSK